MWQMCLRPTRRTARSRAPQRSSSSAICSTSVRVTRVVRARLLVLQLLVVLQREGDTIPCSATRDGGATLCSARREGGSIPCSARREGGSIPCSARREGGPIPCRSTRESLTSDVVLVRTTGLFRSHSFALLSRWRRWLHGHGGKLRRGRWPYGTAKCAEFARFCIKTLQILPVGRTGSTDLCCHTVLLVAPPGLLTRTHCCSQNVDGVQRLKMTAVVSPSGGTYGINLQATQFCGPKAAVPCSSSEPAPAKEDDVMVEPLTKRTTAQKPSTLQGFEEHGRSQSFWCEFRALDLIA